MSGTGSPNLRLLTLNVNGLRDPKKRSQLFHGLKKENYDIICLQETHHSCETEAKQWLQEGSGPGSAWLGPSHWCHFTTASSGVAILFTATAPFTDMRRVGNDPSGRTLRVDFTLHGTDFTVGCVYAPSIAAERPQFFSQLHTHFPLENAPAVAGPSASPRASTSRAPASGASSSRDTSDTSVGRCLLIGGDFNCVADRAIDRIATVATIAPTRTDRGYPELHSCMQILGLADTWRQQNPTERGFTHVSTDRSTASRLDRWLTRTSTHAAVTSHGLVHNLVGDHAGVLIRVTPTNGILQGKGSWRLKPSMLADPAFGSRLRSRLGAFKSKHPLSVSAQATLFLATISHPPPPAATTLLRCS